MPIMSAYAFNSYLSPIETKAEEHKLAIKIKVSSASVNVNTKALTKRSLFPLRKDAVLFKLNICYNGRKYTASRSYAKFFKLRKDLDREMNDPYPYAKRSCTLPKLPESITDQTDYTSISNNVTGFTKLQSFLSCYYCPLMECWLKRIMEIIDYDTSPSFNNFLWEPLRHTENTLFSNCTVEQHRIKKNSFGSALSLCSIHESFESDD